ncbi:oligosaccharide repeat unit polymerase [Lutibacter sp. Hel_I_33_5]|uniref:O-antigen polymerase n=1 Tax=Lutibacter sp. Hel_I_33_5 TaxID=1566289 RepID=UPI00119EE920|nr:O-antigen polymerase [Lutibacter sp. Hel_I_33_5]TVZ56190.1 oligosaccharide repeat unit polymerase [Lutibacter sp. Hel_I_33_5]
MNNIAFIKNNNLVKATLYGLLFWLILFFLVPFNIKQPLGIFPSLFLILNYLSFLIGLKIITTTKKENLNNYTDSINSKVLKSFFYVIVVIALFGFLLKIIDKFYIRGASFLYTISYNRIILENSGPSIISIISALTTPFSFLPLFLYYKLPKKNLLWFFTSILLFFSPTIDFLMMGSRSGIFVIIILLGLYLFYYKKLKLNPIKVIIVIFVLAYLGMASTKLFLERTRDFAKTDKIAINHILKHSGYNFTITPRNSTKNNIIKTKNKTSQAVKLGVINFAQYYLHGVYEFGYLYRNYNKQHYFGAYTFNVFVKFINIIFRTNIDLKKVENSPPRTGVYTSFFGPVFIDFGWFTFIFMFFFGAIQKTIYNKCLEGRFQFIPLLFYFLIINFFMPVFNFINGAQGLYIITTFIIFSIIYKVLTGKLILKKEGDNKKYVKIL